MWDDEIYLMNPDGTNPVYLTNREGAHDRSPTFSADGKKMAFVSVGFEEGDRDRPVTAIYVGDIVGN